MGLDSLLQETMKFLAVFIVSMAPLVMSMNIQGTKEPEGDKEIEEAKLRKELEILVKSLDDDQLELLEAIMGQDIDEAAEFDMISVELKAMGMDEEDIEDLQQLSELMHLFLKQIPAVSTKLELTRERDLLDNVQLYLLGLPNKLGPLGYIALHNVLEELAEADGEIVDIRVEPAVTITTTTTAIPETSAPTFRRKRSSPLEQVMRFRRHV